MGDLPKGETGIRRKLRLITYLSPGVPIQVFETIRDYLEEKTGCHAYIIMESRWSGPNLDREDPFTADEADIGRTLCVCVCVCVCVSVCECV